MFRVPLLCQRLRSVISVDIVLGACLNRRCGPGEVAGRKPNRNRDTTDSEFPRNVPSKQTRTISSFRFQTVRLFTLHSRWSPRLFSIVSSQPGGSNAIRYGVPLCRLNAVINLPLFPLSSASPGVLRHHRRFVPGWRANVMLPGHGVLLVPTCLSTNPGTNCVVVSHFISVVRDGRWKRKDKDAR